MDNFQVLSSEEVEAILKASQESGLSIPAEEMKDASPKSEALYSGINELLRSEFEKTLSTLLRKKITVKNKSVELVPISAILGENTDHKVFSVFHIMPNDRYGMFIVDLPLLHQTINLLFGAQLNPSEPIMEKPGKVGVVVAERLTKICLHGFVAACREYGEVTCQVVKTTHLANLVASFDEQDQVYLLEYTILIDETEVVLRLVVSERFFKEFIPEKAGYIHREKDFWRTAIKTQVVDSYVNINVALPEVTMNIHEFMDLKEGDLIPIGDPTAVFVCLNNIKLFRGTAGQANNRRVVKIINQI